MKCMVNFLIFQNRMILCLLAGFQVVRYFEADAHGQEAVEKSFISNQVMRNIRSTMMQIYKK